MMAVFDEKYITGDHLAQAQGLFEPQHQSAFAVQIGLSSATDSNNIMLSVDTANLPNITFEEMELNYINVKRYVAAKVTYDAMPLTVKDMVDVGVAKALSDWVQTVYDPITEKIFLAKNYKKMADLILFAPDGTYQRSWKLYGCWPQASNFGTLDMSSTDNVKIEMTIRYDKAVPELAVSS